MSDVTRLLDAAAAGDRQAAADLLPLVYDELRQLAAARLAAEKAGHTLQPTALVHEAYLRLVGGDQPDDWNGRGHFFAAAAEAMRRILVDSARRKGRAQARRRPATGSISTRPPSAAADEPGDDLLALDEALDRLAAADPPAAELVKLRYFAGLCMADAAAALGLPRGRPTGTGRSPGPGCTGNSPGRREFRKKLAGRAPGRRTRSVGPTGPEASMAVIHEQAKSVFLTAAEPEKERPRHVVRGLQCGHGGEAVENRVAPG